MALTREEMTAKAMNGTLTVREAIEFGQSLPLNKALKVTESSQDRMGRLVSGFKELGINVDMPYKDLNKFDRVEGMKIVDLLGPSDTPYRSNKWGNLQALENALRPVFDEMGITSQLTDMMGPSGEVVSRGPMYPPLTGESTGRTQRGGKSSAEDNEGTRPMRGTIEKEKIDAMYDEALPQVENDPKYGAKVSRFLEYHRMTVNRPAQLLGLKKTDVIIQRDSDGNILGVKVKGKKVRTTDKKGRPELEWSAQSRGGQIILKALEESESDLLFDVKKTQVETAFKTYITPLLEPFEDLLPTMDVAKKVEGSNAGERVRTKVPFKTIGVMRSIVPNYLIEQFNVRDDLVKGAMGHTNTATLSKNYTGTGLIPTRDIPFLLENPTDYGSENFRGGLMENTGNVVRLTDEQIEKLRTARFELLQSTNLEEQQASLNRFLTLLEEQPAYDPVKVREAGKAKGQAEALFEQGRLEGRAEVEVEAELAGKGPQGLVKFTPEQIETMKANGLWNDDLDRLTNPDYEAPETKGSTTGQKLGVGVAAAGVGMALLDPAQALADEAIQQTGEAATRAIVGKTIARRIPFAEVVIPSDMSADPQENLARAYNRPAQDFYDMTPEQMAPYQQALDDAISSEEQEAVDRRRGRNRARVGSGFLENQQQP